MDQSVWIDSHASGHVTVDGQSIPVVTANTIVVGTGAAGSWSLNNLGPRLIAGNFDPGFFVEHFLKDMGIALAEARRMKLALPGLALAEQLYRATTILAGHPYHRA